MGVLSLPWSLQLRKECMTHRWLMTVKMQEGSSSVQIVAMKFTLVRNSMNICSVSNLVSYIFSKIYVRLYTALNHFFLKVQESFPFYQVDFFFFGGGGPGVSTQSFLH